MNVAVDEQTLAQGEQVRKKARRQRLMLLGGAIAVLGALGFGSWWATTGRYLESTDDAYVRADWVALSARVPGYVAEVLVQDDQPVKAGDVVVRLRDRDYQARLAQAQAAVAEAQATLVAGRASRQVAAERVGLQQQAIAVAEAQVRSAAAESRRAELDRRRYQGLARDNAATVQRLESANASAQQAMAALQGAEAGLRRQQALLSESRARLQLADAEIQQQVAAHASAVARATLAGQDAEDTLIRAPIDGVVGQRRVRAGQYLVAGQPMLAVVPVRQAYVVANYKETQLADMRPGQRVEIHVDSFAHRPLHGRVVSFSPGSGNVFALLPSDNATGNFTKIVQRFPVRIQLDADNEVLPILPGMSVTTVVDTHYQEMRNER
ncbi:HlyD family secretion protein [Pseudomonas asplenii]|uniref:HlyD family secretion protein n=1 Tax=Pseudomonas asplenii TaxID=53407 RepID=UPI0003679BE7|nr:HlyD family secretion protein [Pseudomonas fuscovaginae]